GRLRGQRDGELVAGGGRELPGGAGGDDHRRRADDDAGQGLVDRDADAAGRGQAAGVLGGHLEGVGARVVERGGGVLGWVGGVGAKAHGRGHGAGRRPGVGQVGLAAVVGAEHAQGRRRAGDGGGRGAGGTGDRGRLVGRVRRQAGLDDGAEVRGGRGGVPVGD